MPLDAQVKGMLDAMAQMGLDHFERIGVTECVFRLPSAPRDVVLPILDRQASLVAGRG